LIVPQSIALVFIFVRQNAFHIELCLRLTNGKPALAATATDDLFGSGGSQRRFA
jgi:hypothetical protein